MAKKNLQVKRKMTNVQKMFEIYISQKDTQNI